VKTLCASTPYEEVCGLLLRRKFYLVHFLTLNCYMYVERSLLIRYTMLIHISWYRTLRIGTSSVVRTLFILIFRGCIYLFYYFKQTENGHRKNNGGEHATTPVVACGTTSRARAPIFAKENSHAKLNHIYVTY